MALIDGTTPNQQWYAGVNDQIQTQVDDIARLGLMFAAFQLRDLVSTALDGVDASSGRDALQQIETSWQSVWEKRFPNRKSDAVNYDRIFQVFQAGS